MSSTTPEVGDAMIFEGLASRITGITGDKFEFASELKAEGRDEPRFRSIGFVGDLLYSSRLGAWYLWGRVLGKGRGGVGEDQRALVVTLRDSGLAPARPGRQQGSGPAAGEQHGLFCDLFASGVNWKQEMRNLRTGEGFSTAAKDAIASHETGFNTKRLNHGFAEKDDGDPGFDAVAKGGK